MNLLHQLFLHVFLHLFNDFLKCYYLILRLLEVTLEYLLSLFGFSQLLP
jgi:hypothetical protein